MKLITRILTVFILFFHFIDANAQENEKKLVQFSGVVVTADSLTPIPFVNILIDNTRRGTISDFNGFFSFVAHAGDVIIFSAVGFKRATVKIPDSLTEKRYSWVQGMTTDTILLAETVIYPWPTIERFKEAFVKLEIPEDDYDRAIKNLKLAELKELARNMGMDGAMNYRNFIDKQIYNASYTSILKPSLTNMINNPLLNPFAWAEFVKAWKEGKFKRNQE